MGELSALQWEDIDFKKKVIHVRHTLCYFSKNGKYVFEMHDTKTNNGKRTIPLTAKAIVPSSIQQIKPIIGMRKRFFFMCNTSLNDYRCYSRYALVVFDYIEAVIAVQICRGERSVFSIGGVCCVRDFSTIIDAY